MGERLVKWHPNQQITDTDLSAMGVYARDSLDHVVADAVTASKRFTGFQVVQSGPAKVTVAAGRLYAGGKVYFRDEDGGVELDLSSNLPAAVNKVVTVIVWGQEVDTGIEPRTFLTDVDTEQTSADSVPTETRRVANVDRVAGVEAADPVAPAVDATVLAVADIILSPTGVVSVTARDGNRLPSVGDNADRLADLEDWRGAAGAHLDVLDTTVAGIEAQLSDLPSADLVLETARDIARLKELAQQPEEFTSYGADRFLDVSKSDTANVDYLATVEEGIRFGPAATRAATVALLNPIDSAVKVQDNLALPTYKEVERKRVKGRDGEVSLADHPYSTSQTTRRTLSRTRIRFGSARTVSSGSTWWRSGRFDPVTPIFRRTGEAWSLGADEIVERTKKHIQIRTPIYWEDSTSDEYWLVDQYIENVSGAVIGQTFLNAEAGFLTALGLHFTKKAGSGAITVLITNVEDGEPQFDDIIAKVTVDAADLKVLPDVTKVPFPPTYLEKGRRYAFVVVTAGNHFLATVKDNKVGQGALFYGNAGAFVAKGMNTDLPFSLYFAEFTTPRLELSLQPLQLENGIADIDVNLDLLKPNGTKTSFQVQINGEWVTLASLASNPLIGLPPLLPFRAVLVGTTQVMPALGLNGRSEVITTRPRTDFKHVSAARVLPAACTTVQVTVKLEAWEAAHHTLTMQLRTGGAFSTIESADTVVDKAAADAEAIERVFTFNVSPGVSTFKIVTTGTTDNALNTFHVADRADVSFS